MKKLNELLPRPHDEEAPTNSYKGTQRRAASLTAFIMLVNATSNDPIFLFPRHISTIYNISRRRTLHIMKLFELPRTPIPHNSGIKGHTSYVYIAGINRQQFANALNLLSSNKDLTGYLSSSIIEPIIDEYMIHAFDLVESFETKRILLNCKGDASVNVSLVDKTCLPLYVASGVARSILSEESARHSEARKAFAWLRSDSCLTRALALQRAKYDLNTERTTLIKAIKGNSLPALTADTTLYRYEFPLERHVFEHCILVLYSITYVCSALLERANSANEMTNYIYNKDINNIYNKDIYPVYSVDVSKINTKGTRAKESKAIKKKTLDFLQRVAIIPRGSFSVKPRVTFSDFAFAPPTPGKTLPGGGHKRQGAQNFLNLGSKQVNKSWGDFLKKMGYGKRGLEVAWICWWVGNNIDKGIILGEPQGLAAFRMEVAEVFAGRYKVEVGRVGNG